MNGLEAARERAAAPVPPARAGERNRSAPLAADGHELLAVLARRAAEHGEPAVVRRQPEERPPSVPVRVPGGELTLTPGAPRSLLGSRLLMPGSLRVASLLAND